MLIAALALTLAAEKQSDILIIIADDFGQYDIEHIETPNLDALAASGITFTRTYSNSVCTPSRDSLMTGMWSNIHNEFTCEPGRRDDFGVPSLGNVLEVAGFETGYFGKWHLGQSPVAPYQAAPHLWGWEVARAWNTASMRGICTNQQLIALGAPKGTHGNYTHWPTITDGVETISLEYNTAAILNAFKDWKEEARGPNPRGAVISFNTPHGPFHLPPGQEVIPDPTKRQLYEAMVRNMDQAVGEVLALAAPDTWIVFVGDNGTDPKARAADQLKPHLKGSTYEGGLRVPMIWRRPGITPGSSTDALVHFADILPTIMDAFGIGGSAGMDGRSLLPLLAKPSAPSPHEYVYAGCRPGVEPAPLRHAVISRDGWKLSEDRPVEGDASWRMFNLFEDPDELHRIDPNEHEDRELVAKLRGWLAAGEE